MIDTISITNFSGPIFDDGSLPPSDIDLMDHLVGYDGVYIKIYREAVTVEINDETGKVIGEGVCFPRNSFIPMSNISINDDGDYIDVEIHINDRFRLLLDFDRDEFARVVQGTNVGDGICENQFISQAEWNSLNDYEKYAYQVRYHRDGKVETYHYKD